MPELPEVECVRLYIDNTFKDKVIKSIYIDKKDHIVFDHGTPAQIRKALQGRRVKGVGRKGKFFWIELDSKPWLIIHFGMTGNAAVFKDHAFLKIWDVEEKDKKSWLAKKEQKKIEKIPPYCKLLIEFSDGSKLAFSDPRRFGRIRLSTNPLQDKPISEMGPDPLEEFPSVKALQKLFHKRRAPIKTLLLDQRYFAGVGNWIADEILFQSNLSPHRAVNSLSVKEIACLRKKTLSIIKLAVKLNADYTRYPDDWLFHDRWSKGTEAYTSRGYEIRHDTIGGRTAAWVPALQS